MCTSILELVACNGSGKSPEGWVSLTHAAISYDHPHHAMLNDAVTIDFVNKGLKAGTRVGIELDLESAKLFHKALERVIRDVEDEKKSRPRSNDLTEVA